MFIRIAVSVTDSATVNPNCIKTLLANFFSIFSIKSKPFFSNGREGLPRNPPDCPI